uniref:Uncharacterized protein n=1 Tax=Cacopsylla melanoneura TaxID=428564 RepID=A0A8D8REA8_9HEMI
MYVFITLCPRNTYRCYTVLSSNYRVCYALLPISNKTCRTLLLFNRTIKISIFFFFKSFINQIGHKELQSAEVLHGNFLDFGVQGSWFDFCLRRSFLMEHFALLYIGTRTQYSTECTRDVL